MELISREEVKSTVQDYFNASGLNAEAIIENIDKLPIVESRPKGEWVKDYRTIGGGYMWQCSECGNNVYVDSREDYPNYCAECGADMRGKE